MLNFCCYIIRIAQKTFICHIILYPEFDLQNFNEDECLPEFRFKKTDIPSLARALLNPDVIVCYQRTICDGIEHLV